METKKRVNEFKLKHMKIINEGNAVKEEEGAQIGAPEEFDPRNNDAMIRTEYGMQARFHAR